MLDEEGLTVDIRDATEYSSVERQPKTSYGSLSVTSGHIKKNYSHVRIL